MNALKYVFGAVALLLAAHGGAQDESASPTVEAAGPGVKASLPTPVAVALQDTPDPNEPAVQAAGGEAETSIASTADPVSDPNTLGPAFRSGSPAECRQ